jgi:septation ring formation regulator EzrA
LIAFNLLLVAAVVVIAAALDKRSKERMDALEARKQQGEN